MNGLRTAAYIIIILGAVIAIGLLGPFNPSCGTGVIGFFSSLFGTCQSYASYVGVGIIIGGVVLVAVAKDEE